MIKYVLLIILTAYITYTIELPIISCFLYKTVDFKYLNIIVLLVNLITNIILNAIIIPISALCFGNQVYFVTIMISELLIICAEYLLYKIAFIRMMQSNTLEKFLVISTIVANIISFLIGKILNVVFLYTSFNI